MAADPQRTNQPLVNGQNDENSSSKGNADRDTVGGESQEQQERPRPPPQLNWPRQQRPQEFGRGFTQQNNRFQGVIRRASPWSVLKAKLPDQPIRPGHEHYIQRMQNPEERPKDSNGTARPPSAGMRPPGPMSRPPSQDSLTPMTSPGPPSPRSPYLQRSDSRTGMMPMPRQMSLGRPPSSASTGRSMDDDDDVVMTGSPQSRPGSGRPIQSPVGIRPGGPSPVRPPPNWTPPQSPAPQGMPPMRSPQPGRQSSLTSLSEQGENKQDPPVSRPPSAAQNENKSETPISRPPSVAQNENKQDQPISRPPLVAQNGNKQGQPISRPPSAAQNENKQEQPMSRPPSVAQNENKQERPISRPPSVAQNENQQEQPISRPPSVAQNHSRPPSIRSDSASSQPSIPDTPSPPKPLLNGERSPSITINEPDVPKRPTDLTGPPRDITSTNGEVKESTNDAKKETIVNGGNQDSPKKSPTKAATPKKLGNVTPVKSPSKISPKTPETPGTADKKSISEISPKHNTKQIKQEEILQVQEVHWQDKQNTPDNKNIKRRVRIKEPEENNLKHTTFENTSKKHNSQNLTNYKKGQFNIPDENEQNKVHFQEKKIDDIKINEVEEKSPSTLNIDSTKPATPKATFAKQDSQQKQFPETPLIKVPMNKVQVGAAPSPNLKSIKSKIGSLENAKHKPGGGNIKIENRKLNFSATPKIAAKNDTYTPKGGEKKIQNVKLQWNAKSKIGSLENTTHKPGGGDKKIESVKLDFKEKAKPKVGSKDNIKHTPGGGTIKNSGGSQDGNPSDIEDQKLEIKASSKIGSLDNVKHRPGGGEVKIFDDKEYLKQMAGPSDVHAPAHQDKKSRSNSTSRNKLSESRSETIENLSEKPKSPEKFLKSNKPMDQNSNQLRDKKDKEMPKIEIKNDKKDENIPIKPPEKEEIKPIKESPNHINQTNGITTNNYPIVEKSLTEKTEKEQQKPEIKN